MLFLQRILHEHTKFADATDGDNGHRRRKCIFQ